MNNIAISSTGRCHSDGPPSRPLSSLLLTSQLYFEYTSLSAEFCLGERHYTYHATMSVAVMPLILISAFSGDVWYGSKLISPCKGPHCFYVQYHNPKQP